MKYDLRKSQKLLTSEDFDYLKKQSQTVNSSFIRVYFKNTRLRPSDKVSRIGISVSKKVGNAVVRNSLKRLTREFFRKSNIRDLGVDMLLVASPRLSKEDNFKEIFKKDLHKTFNLIIKKTVN